MWPLLLLLAGAANAAPPTWTKETVAWNYGDVASLMSLTVTSMLRHEMEPPFTAVNFVLMDAEGRMVVEFAMESSALAKLQALPPGKQTAFFTELRSKMINNIRAGTNAGRGLFGKVHGLPERSFGKLVDWMNGDGGKSLVVHVGFEQDGKSHLYATVDASGVTFDKNAPTAR